MGRTFDRALTADRVALRPLERADLQARVRWINDPETSSLLMFDFPTSMAKTEQWFSGTLMDATKAHFTIVPAGEPETAIGMTGLLDISTFHRRAQMYITIGETGWRGQRLADEVIPMVLGYAFVERGLNRVYLYTLPNNAAARRVYERMGFRAEGVLRDHYYCVGDLQDLHVHAVLRQEWLG